MKVQVEELSPIERKLFIEVEGTRVAEELERAYSALNRQVKVAGFRPGKVPRRILEQRFKDQVEDDVTQRVVQRAYLEAIRDHRVEAVSNPQVSNTKALNPKETFSFEARVEVKPKLEPKDYKGLPLKRETAQVDDAKVEEQVERIRQNLSRLEPVEGREHAAKGDFAVIDYESTVDGNAYPGSKAEDVTVEVTDGELIQGNLPQLEGQKLGESRELDYAFPEDYRVEEVRGKTAHFRITLKSLKAKVLPELNDELAKEAGAGDTLADLRGKIRQELERAEKQRIEQAERDAVLKSLIERNPFEVPRAMVERATDMMLRGMLRSMQERGVDPRYLGMDFEKLREDMRERATTEVKGTLLLEAISEAEKIEATEEDVDKRLQSLSDETGVPLSQVKKRFKDAQEKEALYLRVREEKTLEFLKTNAQAQ